MFYHIHLFVPSRVIYFSHSQLSFQATRLYMDGLSDISSQHVSLKLHSYHRNPFSHHTSTHPFAIVRKTFVAFHPQFHSEKAIIKINGSLILLSMPHSHFHSHAQHYYTKEQKEKENF